MLIDEVYKNCFDGETAVIYCGDDMNIYLDKRGKGFVVSIDDGQYVQVEIRLPKKTDFETALLQIIKALIDRCNMFRHKASDYEWELNEIIKDARFMLDAHKEDEK